MKKNIIFSFAFLGAMLLSSCQKETIDHSVTVPCDENRGNPISFLASCDGNDFSAGVTTKATAEITALDSFYVSATTGQYGSETSVWSQAVFSKSSGSSLYKSDKYWPISDPGYHFYASNVEMVGGTACTVSAGSGTDIVCAYLDNPGFNESDTLKFAHIFARIGTVSISAQDGYEIKVSGISISCPVSGTYSIYKGFGRSDDSGWTADSETTINLKADSHEDYVVPGNYTLSVSYTLSKGAWVQSFQKTADVTLTKGKINNIKGTATGGTASDIQLAVNLTAWDTNDINVEWN